MLTFMAVLLMTLVGIALGIFGVLATIAGLAYLLAPVIIIVGGFIFIGYLVGKRKSMKKVEKPEEKDEEDE